MESNPSFCILMDSLSPNSPPNGTTNGGADSELTQLDPDIVDLLQAWQLEDTPGTLISGCNNGLEVGKDIQGSSGTQAPSLENQLSNNSSPNTIGAKTNGQLLTEETTALGALLLGTCNFERNREYNIRQLIEAFSTVEQAFEGVLMNGLDVDLASVQALLNKAKNSEGDEAVTALKEVSVQRKALEQVLSKKLYSPLSTLPTSALPSLSLVHTFVSTCINQPSRFFFDMEISGDPVGRIIVETRPDVAPNMSENFRCLATGEKGFGFKGCSVFQCWSGESVITGDFEHNNGRGGFSIYDGNFTPEETSLPSTRGAIGMRRTQKRHDSKGLVGSQFRILLKDLPAFTAIFGRVVEGIEVVDKISQVGDTSGTPTKLVVIRRCGKL